MCGMSWTPWTQYACDRLPQDGRNGAVNFNMRDKALLPGAEGNEDSHTESMKEFQGS